LKDSWRIYGGFVEDSWRIHGGFMEDSWRIHGGFQNDVLQPQIEEYLITAALGRGARVGFDNLPRSYYCVTIT